MAMSMMRWVSVRWSGVESAGSCNVWVIEYVLPRKPFCFPTIAKHLRFWSIIFLEPFNIKVIFFVFGVIRVVVFSDAIEEFSQVRPEL